MSFNKCIVHKIFYNSVEKLMPFYNYNLTASI